MTLLDKIKARLATEPVWVIQALNAAVGIAVAVLGGGDWQSLVPSLLVALSAPMLRSKVTPVRIVGELVNKALHTPAPGPGPVEAAPTAAPVAAVAANDLPPTR